ncbi:SDR family NAD(P)-dependent oxidoreductase [Pseudomonas sp. CC120222-01a]|uniref:SDR family NAD(P)-dependent oxidoreductase n=1 Tax=Pseudomonas sp. CC120222-01a TaxID=1378075 RepID=UPI000D9C507F|nr:SDR family NAD(P)-dependent oxidoreductase [Pseudomonas sp. CC120222-01a]PVZ41225.1 short-subunit dehydrogenase [Pseudomonas sp. CC120222-01a]
MKNWFITGVSRGLGLAMARAALAKGDRVLGTARAAVPELQGMGENLRILNVDMGDAQGVVEAVHEAFKSLGRIDVVVNNAGYGVLGAVEVSSDAQVRQLFEVNLYSPIRIVRTALPYLREQKSGHIINITSIAGRAPGVGSAIYAASKFALEGFSASLAQEVEPLGLHVTAVAPGQFRTDFLAETSLQETAALAEYSPTVAAALKSMSTLHEHQLGDPALAAEAIVQLAHTEEPPLHLLLGSDALDRAKGKLKTITAEMARWESVTIGTDFKS